MQQKLNAAMSQLSFDNPPRRTNSNPPVSPSPRNSRHLDPSTIQAMFPDAAAALAHQRSLLTSNRNSINGGISSTTTTTTSAAAAPRSPALQAAKDAWPNETPVAAKIRPRSADLSTWNVNASSTPTQQLKSPAVPQATPSIAEDLTSPFGGPSGASWASMVNTPVVPMFQNPHTTSQRGDTDIAGTTAMKLAAWNANKSSVSGGIINLDTDVRKFRRGRTQQQSQQGNLDMLATPPHGMNRGGSPTNIVMYDEHGNLVQLAPHLAQQLRSTGSPLSTVRQTSPRPTSPYHPPGFAQFPAMAGLTSPIGPPAFLNPYDTSPVLSSSEFAQGYLSDYTSDRRRGDTSPLGLQKKYPPANNRRSSSAHNATNNTNKEDPTDPSLMNDIPAWLRSLRLHKYTENLSDIKGGVLELAKLGDAELEKRGVSAIGARRKLLKCFEQVRSSVEGGTKQQQPAQESSN